MGGLSWVERRALAVADAQVAIGWRSLHTPSTQKYECCEYQTSRYVRMQTMLTPLSRFLCVHAVCIPRSSCVCVCVHAHTESCALIPSATASMIPSGGLKKACCSAAQCVAMRGAKWTRHLLVPPWSGLRKAHCMSLLI